MIYQPKFRIRIVGPQQFVTPYRWVREGNVSQVLHGRFDIDGSEIDAYAKVLRLSDPAGRVESVNEVTGWLIAQACGLPVAARAFIAAVRAEDLPADPTNALAPPHDRHVYMFGTEEISRAQPVGAVSTEDLVREQAVWRHCHGTIAFDEWIGNADRHVNNLVRRAAKDFVLIDHGRLLSRADQGPCWVPQELAELVSTQFGNLLHRHVYDHLRVTSRQKVNAGFRASADNAKMQADNTLPTLHEIAYWCSVLAPGHSAEWLRFLCARVRNAEPLLRRRFRLTI